MQQAIVSSNGGKIIFGCLQNLKFSLIKNHFCLNTFAFKKGKKYSFPRQFSHHFVSCQTVWVVNDGCLSHPTIVAVVEYRCFGGTRQIDIGEAWKPQPPPPGIGGLWRRGHVEVSVDGVEEQLLPRRPLPVPPARQGVHAAADGDYPDPGSRPVDAPGPVLL